MSRTERWMAEAARLRREFIDPIERRQEPLCEICGENPHLEYCAMAVKESESSTT